jgi:hypothetical protein
MTEYELADLVNSLGAEAGRSTMDFVTVLFGYVVSAHFIGAGLSRAYAVALSAIYTCFAVFPIIGVSQAGSVMYAVVHSNPEMSESLGMFTSGPDVRFVPLVLLGSAWALSLAYMYRVRKIATAS